MDFPEFKITVGNYNNSIHFNINVWDNSNNKFDIVPYSEIDNNYRLFILNMLNQVYFKLAQSTLPAVGVGVVDFTVQQENNSINNLN